MAIHSRHANRATIYHVPTGQHVGTVAAESTIKFYIFNKDGRRLALRDSANRLTVWDTEQASLVASLGVVSPNNWVLLQTFAGLERRSEWHAVGCCQRASLASLPRRGGRKLAHVG